MKHQNIRRFVPLVLLIVLLATAIIYLSNVTEGEAKELKASGSVEAVEVLVAPESAGRVAQVLVEEGDDIQKGDLLFQLEDDLLQAQRNRAVSALETAKAQLALAKAGATEEEIAAAEGAVRAARSAVASAEAARLQAEIKADSARTFEQTESSVAMAEAALAQARGLAESAKAELARTSAQLERLLAGARPEEIAMYQSLLNQAQSEFLYFENIHFDQFISKDISGGPEERARYQRESARGARDAAQARLDMAIAGPTDEEVAVARAAVQTAQAQVNIAEAGVASAEAALAQAKGNPVTAEDQVLVADASISAAGAQVALAEGQLAQAEAQLARLQAGATPEELAVFETQIEQAQSEIDLIDLQSEKLAIRAAVDGVIMTRAIEPGEIVQPGTVAMTIGQLNELEITVYVPEDRYGQIRLGEIACVVTDSFPGDCFEATVTRIADKAEFTPRNVQTEEGRRTTVFAVTLSVDDPSGRLKPGMPADVSFQNETS